MIYALGDIHGQIARLDEAFALIEKDGGSDAPLVFVGDYMDRGPRSDLVVQCLIDGTADGRNWTVLRGNHDRMFTRFMRDRIIDDAHITSGKGWFHPVIGGQDTLAAYGVTGLSPTEEIRTPDWLDDLWAEAQTLVPQAHIDFLDSRPLWHRAEDFLFVHAGLRPGVSLEKQREDDLIWIREGWLDDTRDHGAMVVHGHTTLDFPTHHGNRINIDAGAGYGRPLRPVVFEDNQAWVLTETGRQRLDP